MKITLGKVNLENLVDWAIVMFPVVNIAVAFLNNGDGLFSLYVIYSCMIFFFLGMKKYSTLNVNFSKRNIFLVFLLVFEGFFSCLIANNISFMSDYILFAFCILFWIIFFDDVSLDKFEQFFLENKNVILSIQCVYYLVLLMSVLYGTGIDKEAWGTVTLKGPYGINHLLAYELTFFLLMDIIYWMKKNTFFTTILIIVNLALILLTGVRGSLLAVAAALFLAFSAQRTKKQVVIIILGIVLFIYLFFKTDLFNALIEKTNNAIAIGSATNGRGKIFVSSLLAYVKSDNIVKWLMGIGHEALLLFNRQNIRMTIHAHNDLIDALVQYGVIGLGIYIISFKNFVFRGEKIYWPALIVFFCLAGFNGYYMYQSSVIMSPILLVYARSIYTVKNEIFKV